ncbi:MAG: heavy metal translocating P-type ATPase [Planctomycetota bacterium]
MAATSKSADVRHIDRVKGSETVVCCTWCGLPVAGATGSSTTASRSAIAEASRNAIETVYCCFGCRMAHAVTEEKGQAGAVRWAIVRLGLAIFFCMNLMAFTMTMWSLDVYDVQRDTFQTQLFEVFRWLSMIFSLPVLLLLGVPLLQNAILSWRQRIFSTDLLIATGVVAAYLVSVMNVFRGEEAIYFEVGATVLVMVTLGRWFEATGKQKATESLDQLAALLPLHATRIKENGHEEVACDEILEGDQLQIRPGERFPTDAVLMHGETTVDEQVFTGESMPVAKKAGDRILGGTVNLEGLAVVCAIAPFRGGSFGRLLRLLQSARLSRGHYHRLADRISAWVFPVMTSVAILTLIVHWHRGVGIAIQNSLSVLLIACPCALGLATPLAVWTALSTAARHQVLFRSGESIERLATVRAICFDKTGTLTTGSPRVNHLCMLDDQDSKHLLPLCLELASTSTHPFSQAIARFCERSVGATEQTSAMSVFACVRSVPGAGVEGMKPDGTTIRLGSLEFASAGFRISSRVHHEMIRALAIADQEAASIVAFSVAHSPVILFLLTETMRSESSSAIQACLDLDLPVTVLTGDRTARAEQLRRNLLGGPEHGWPCRSERRAGSSVCTGDHRGHGDHANQVGNPLRAGSGLHVECDLKPEQKVERLKDIRRSRGSVAMVGDGINDAPALAISDIGIAMGCGADISRDSAQVCLLSNQLSLIPWAVTLARQTRRVIRQNLFWAFGYNTAGVILAAFGYLNPAVAAGLMIVSSLIVITNSARLMAESPSGETSAAQAMSFSTTAQPVRAGMMPSKVALKYPNSEEVPRTSGTC